MAVTDATKGQNDPRLRNLRKKLSQIAAIEEKCAADGCELSEEQTDKVNRKAELEAEIDSILNPPEPAAVPAEREDPASDTSKDGVPKVGTDSSTGSSKELSAKAKEFVPKQMSASSAEFVPKQMSAKSPEFVPKDRAKQNGDKPADEKTKPCTTSGGSLPSKAPKETRPMEVKLYASIYDGVDVFQSCEDGEWLRTLRKGEMVQAAGEPREVDGFMMLPIQPKGAVELQNLKEQPPEEEKQPEKVKDKPAEETKLPAKVMTYECIAKEAAVFKSCDNDEYLRSLKKGDIVHAAGPAKTIDGFPMLPIKPRGAVEMQFLKEAPGAVSKDTLPSSSQEGQPEDPRVRALRKKLGQIEVLEQKYADGVILTEEQIEKCEKRDELVEELEELLKEKEKEKAKENTKLPPSIRRPSIESDRPSGLITPSRLSPSMRSVNPCRSPSGHPCMSPSMRWRDDPLTVEDIAPAKDSKEKEKPKWEFIENLQPFANTTQSDERLKELMGQVSVLSADAFEENALSMVSRKTGWKMTIMARPAGFEEADDTPLDGFCLDAAPAPSLIGFLIYRLRPDMECLSIAKLAVVPEHRQQGHGRRFIEWCIKSAKKQQGIAYISLSSLPEAVKFYVRLGFKAIDVDALKMREASGCGADEDLVEGQVYMEYRIKGRSSGGKKPGGKKR